MRSNSVLFGYWDLGKVKKRKGKEKKIEDLSMVQFACCGKWGKERKTKEIGILKLTRLIAGIGGRRKEKEINGIVSSIHLVSAKSWTNIGNQGG